MPKRKQNYKIVIPKGFFRVTRGATCKDDLVWNQDKKKWESVDSINEYISEYIAVIRSKRVKCILNVDSPSFPPANDERLQCGCKQCLKEYNERKS